MDIIKDEPTFHLIIKGETLYDIARRYGTTVAAIREANQIGYDDLTAPGSTIRIYY